MQEKYTLVYNCEENKNDRRNSGGRLRQKETKRRQTEIIEKREKKRVKKKKRERKREKERKEREKERK